MKRRLLSTTSWTAIDRGLGGLDLHRILWLAARGLGLIRN